MFSGNQFMFVGSKKTGNYMNHIIPLRGEQTMINRLSKQSKSKSSILFTEQLEIDVLIAGAGPTGSTLASDLLRRGQRVRIVDKAPHAFKGSRAKGVQPRTQEVFEDLGILDEAHNEGGPYPLAGFHFGPIIVPWRMQSQNKKTPDIPYPNILLLSQHRTDAILHRLIERQGLNIEYNTAVEAFEQDDDAVTVTLSSGE